MLINTITIGVLHTHMFLESSLCENSHLHYNEKLDVLNYNGKHEKQDVFLPKIMRDRKKITGFKFI